jgi:hypothetical protein
MSLKSIQTTLSIVPTVRGIIFNPSETEGAKRPDFNLY